MLKEYIDTGTLVSKKEIPVFSESIGKLIRQYMSDKTNLRLARHTIEEYEHNSLNGLTLYEAYTRKQIDITVQKEKIRQ